MKQARILSSAFLLFLLWWLLAVWMDNDFIIPYPLDVGKLMVAQLQSATFIRVHLSRCFAHGVDFWQHLYWQEAAHFCLIAYISSMICFILFFAHPQCSQYFLYHRHSFMVRLGKQCGNR